jgi:type IV secretory pathway VirB6-like protein
MFENLGKGDISDFATSGTDIVRSIFTTERPSEYEGKVKAIFTNIIKNESYQTVIRTVTTLFVIITAISYLIGVTNVNQAMLIKNLFKIAVIHQLLTAESSWNFFYDNFFVLFIRGIDNFIGIMMGSILGAETNGLYVYDSILELLVGDAVFKKLVALLFSGDSFMDVFISIAFVIVFYIAVIYIFIAIGKAVVTYIIAMTTIGILILLFPIIFSFYLFSITSEIFENWLKTLLTYTLQPILLMAGLSLITTVIIEDIYLQLGFRAWYHPTTVVPMPSPQEDFKINIWQPIYVSKENDIKANILIPRAHTKEDGTYCKPYECSENRYINYPYIDPNNEKHMDVLDNFHQKQFIQKKLLFELIVVVYLLRKFISYTDELARTLADTQESQTDVDTMRSGLGSSFGKMAAGGGVAAAALPAATAASSVSVGKKAVSSTPKIAFRAAGKASRNLPKAIPLSMKNSRAESGKGLVSAEDKADDFGDKKSKMAESSQQQQQKASDSMAKAEQSSSHHQQKAEQAREKQQRFSGASGSKSKLKNLGAGISGKVQEKYHKTSSKAAQLAGQSKGKFYDSKAKFQQSKANKYGQKQGRLHKSIDIGQVVAQNKAMSRGKITKAIFGEKVVKTKQVKEAKRLQNYREDEDKLERLEKKSQDKAEQLKTTQDDSKMQKLQKKTSKAGANIESMFKFEGLRKKALQAKLNAKDDLNTKTTKKQDAKELARGIKGTGKDVKGILVNTLKTSKKVYSGISDQIDKGGIDLDPENFVKNKASKLSNYLGNWNEQRKQKWKKKQEKFEQKEREKDKKNAEEIEKIKNKNKSRAEEGDNRTPDYSSQGADAAPSKQEAEELAKARLASELKPSNEGPVDPREEQNSESLDIRGDEDSREESNQKADVSEDKDENNNSAQNDKRLNKESSEVQRLVREENIDIEEARKRDKSNTTTDKSRNGEDNNN